MPPLLARRDDADAFAAAVCSRSFSYRDIIRYRLLLSMPFTPMPLRYAACHFTIARHCRHAFSL